MGYAKSAFETMICLNLLICLLQVTGMTTEVLSIYPQVAPNGLVAGTDPITMVYKDAVVPLDADYSTTDELVFTSEDSLSGEVLPLWASHTPFWFDIQDSGEIRGSIRWVTTYIARFIISDTYNNDLNFTVQTNPFFDSGMGVDVEEFSERSSYTTSSLTISSSVYSKATAECGGISGIWPEVQPDGVIKLTSSVEVWKEFWESIRVTDGFTLQFGLCIIEGNGWSSDPQGWLSAEVDSYHDTVCLTVWDVASKLDTTFFITFNQGAVYNEKAGLLKGEIRLGFSTLKSFTLDRKDTSLHQSNKVNFEVYHGIGDKETFQAELESSLTINTIEADSVPFTVTLDNCSFTLEIIGIATDTTYNIEFPDVQDYWGLHLQTNEIVFTTDSVPSGYAYPTSTLTYLPDENLTIGWPLFALKAPEGKEEHTYVLDAFKVSAIGVRDFVTKVVKSPSITWRTVSAVSRETYMEHVYSESLPAEDTEEWDVLNVKLEPSPGLYLIWLDLPAEDWYETDRVIVVQQTDLNVVMVDDSEGGFLVWVTSFTSDELVQGAVVSLYQDARNGIEVIAEDVTDEDGLAYIQGDNIEYSGYSHLLVEHEEQYALILNTWTSAKYLTQSKAVLTTDRSLYDIGETVNVYVILRVLEEDLRWVIPDSDDLSYYLVVTWNSDLGMETYPITFDSTFGTATAALQIPNDKLAYNGETTIILRKDKSWGFEASTTIMVASPRIPTSSLSVETLATTVNLNGDAELQLQAVLLTDTKNPIQGSEVAFYLTTTDSTLNEHNELRSVSTDERGSALLSEKIEDIFPGIEAGQSISWRVEVTGPTGELLLEEGIVGVELSEWNIEIDLSFADFIIPGWPVQATIIMEGPSSSQSDQIQPTMVLYTESCDEDNFVDEISCNGYECNFDLPEAANPFHLQASLVDPLGTTITTDCVEITDWSADDWEIRRINELPGPQVTLDKDLYEIGDSVVIKYFNSLPNARALFRWGSTISKRVEITDVLSRGIQTKTITLGDECTDSCKLVVALASAKLDDVATNSPDFVKFSLLYKEQMPKFVSDIVDINVNAAKSMEISITADATEVQPGETIGMTINADPYSQVLIMAIDQSYLEISPHSLPPLAEDYELDLKSNLGVTALQNGVSSVDVIEEAWDKYKRMRAENPFLSPCWKFHSIGDYSNTNVAFIDQSDEMFLEYYSCEHWTGNYDDHSQSVVYFDSIFRNVFAEDTVMYSLTSEGTMPSYDVGSASQEGTSDVTAAAYIRSNFDPNPLFELVETNSAGEATISFTLPDDIATFEVRALAVNNDMFGVAEVVEVISKKPVSMQALQPLFVREEDQFDAGVTISLSNGNSMSVVVTRGDDESHGVELVGTTPVPVIFTTSDLEAGDHVEQYVLSSANGEQLDGLQTILPVRTFMDPINVGSSMALSEGEGDVWREVISFPEGTSPVNFRIIAGNGFKASVQVLAEKFGRIDEDWITGSEALAVVTVNNLLELNGQEDIQYNDSIFLEKLNQLTTDAYGLRWFSSSASISIWLNLNAVYFASYGNDDTISHLVPLWQAAAENEMLSDIANMINEPYDAWTTIALAHLAFGRDWVPPHDYLTRSRLLSNIEYASVEAKSYFCLAFYLDPVDGIEEAIASNILDELSDTIHVQGQTAYVSSSGSTEPWSQSIHGLIVSASALRAKRNGWHETDNILQKLAVYVSQGSSSCWYWNKFDDLHAIIALIHYDELVGSTEGNPLLKIVDASSTIFEETVPSTSPSIVSEWVWEEVWVDELELELDFTVQGEGEVRVAISTLYIPALSEVPLSRGLVVNRIIRAYDRITLSGYGPHLQNFESGKLYLVKIEVTTPDVVRDVFLDDYLPGGLEPLDPSLYELSGSSPLNWDYYSHWCWWCWMQTFDSDATFMADRVRWYATRMSAGTHEVSYIALANVPGIYNHPPASSWVSEQPEVMGMSAGQITVVQSSSSEYELLDEQISGFQAVLSGCNRALNADEICDMTTGQIILMYQVLSGDFGNGELAGATLVREKLGDWLWYIIGIAVAVILCVFGYLNRSRCISNTAKEGVTPGKPVKLDPTIDREGVSLMELGTSGKLCEGEI